jgi:hypothetical protein
MRENRLKQHGRSGYQLVTYKTKDYMGLKIHGILRSVMCVTALLCIGWIYADAAEGASTISEGDEWHFFKGTELPPSKWSYLNHDVSGWQKGRTGIGYGTGQVGTLLDDMKGIYQTVYARREFHLNNPLTVKAMKLRIDCDGPFAAFINGIEVIANSGPVNEELDISGFADMLPGGRNVLAVQCTNDDLHSDNFSFTPSFTVYED